MSTITSLRRTSSAPWLIVPRLIAGLPLAGLGLMHLIGAAPMKPILEAAQIPLPDLNAIVAPIVEVIAGLLLLSGAFARIGGALGAVTMFVAIYAHVIADWPDEPPIALPIATLLAALTVVAMGGGRWSVDRSQN